MERSGLHTSISLISGADLWFYCALIILIAIVGKFGGASHGYVLAWSECPESTDKNTHGLIELVALIGLNIGVLSPTLFAMMVLIALITTFMTLPLLELIYPTRLIHEETALPNKSQPTY